MSIPVELDALQAKSAEYGWAYLLTVGDDLRSKIVAGSPQWDDGVMCFNAGGGSARNAHVRTLVCVTFPPLEPDGYSLIVDGVATVDETAESGPIVRVTATGAVLHRSAPAGFANTATGCSHDCAPVGDVDDQAR